MIDNVHPTTKIRSTLGPPKDLVVVDTSWVLYRCFYSYKNLSAHVGGVEVPTGDIFGFLRGLGAIITRRPQAAVVLCIDSPNTARKAENSDYKAGRESNPTVYAKLQEIVDAAMLLPGVFVSFAEGLEADDLMYSLAVACSGHMEQVFVHSGDDDLLQAVRPNVHVFRKMEQKKFILLGQEYIQEKFGVSSSQHLPMLRAIRGDSSDNLKGYPRFPTKLAIKIAEKYESPLQLLQDLNPEDWEKKEWSWIKKIIEDPETITRNFSLMKLETLPQPHLYKGEGSWDSIKKYQMRSIEGTWKKILESSK